MMVVVRGLWCECGGGRRVEVVVRGCWWCEVCGDVRLVVA